MVIYDDAQEKPEHQNNKLNASSCVTYLMSLLHERWFSDITLPPAADQCKHPTYWAVRQGYITHIRTND